MDIGLAQAILNLNLVEWFLNPLQELINKGGAVEAFVGQEMIAYGNPYVDNDLYYWHRDTRTGKAEVDYVIQQGENIIPVEIKGAKVQLLKAFICFLKLIRSHLMEFASQRIITLLWASYTLIHCMLSQNFLPEEMKKCLAQ